MSRSPAVLFKIENPVLVLLIWVAYWCGKMIYMYVDDVVGAGGKKRAAWDLKGRLLDMEKVW